MKPENHIIALAQSSSVPYNKNANMNKIRDMMARASANKADAVVFPELFLSGYLVWDRLKELAESANGEFVQRIAQYAKRYKLLTVCGFPEINPNGNPFNSAIIIDRDGSVAGVYRKTHLFGREQEFFTPGDDIPVFDTSLGRIGVMITYDSEFPEVARILAICGAKLVFMPTANMDPYSEYQFVMLRSRAMENGIYIATANSIGADGVFCYFGQSVIVEPHGKYLCFGGPNEDLLIGEVDLSNSAKPTDLPYLQQRRPELYKTLSVQNSNK